MTPLPPPIDHMARYRQHLAASGFEPRPAAAWDQRAPQYNGKRQHDDYIAAFLGHIDLRGARTVLDVGCGPGLLSLPIAAQVQQVHALDYSQGMLDALGLALRGEHADNVKPRRLSWEDDWHDVPVCDVAIASRSLMVADLDQALSKLDAHASQRAYLSFVTAPPTGVAELAALLGRQWVAMPDYRYVLALLWDMGREPRLDYLPPVTLDRAQSRDALVERAEQLFGHLNAAERDAVRRWHARSRDHRLGLSPTRRWAFIGWETAR